MDKYFDNGFLLIAGPCVIEDRDSAMRIAEDIIKITEARNLPFIFKASYRKANRSRLDSFTGIGDDKALRILEDIRNSLNVPVTTDVHSPAEAKLAASIVDVLQIPAFLCRQTDLLVAAAQTGKIVNIKKGQFLSPESMIHAVTKVKESGNEQVWLTERGTTFGYQDLVVDYRGIPIMKNLGTPVIMDCTHALQKPNQSQGVTGGNPQFIETIARAAIAVGADGLFIETHPNPQMARSDGANMLHLDHLDDLLSRLTQISDVIRNFQAKPVNP